MKVTRTQSMPNFSKTNISYPLCASVGNKCSFFGIFCVLCFLITSILRLDLLPITKICRMSSYTSSYDTLLLIGCNYEYCFSLVTISAKCSTKFKIFYYVMFLTFVKNLLDSSINPILAWFFHVFVRHATYQILL